MKQPEYLRATKALTLLLNTDAFYISTEKDPPSPLAGSFSCRQQSAASRQPPALWASPTHKAAGRDFFCGLPSADCAHFHRLHAISWGPSQRASRSRICVVSQTGPQGHRTHIRQRQPSAVSISSRILYITGYMIGSSWFVKACHYTRMGCGQTSQRAALWASPTHKAAGLRSFPSPACDFVGAVPKGGPLQDRCGFPS